MDSEIKGWTIVGCSLIAGIVIITSVSLFYYDAKNKKISDMVKSGADPVACAVALDNVYDDKAKAYFLSKK